MFNFHILNALYTRIFQVYRRSSHQQSPSVEARGAGAAGCSTNTQTHSRERPAPLKRDSRSRHPFSPRGAKTRGYDFLSCAAPAVYSPSVSVEFSIRYFTVTVSYTFDSPSHFGSQLAFIGHVELSSEGEEVEEATSYRIWAMLGKIPACRATYPGWNH
ncbi:hypothetical protein EVAR_77849_1 [Eumeta japonica]|uniref:Uncharacterized protein n=1 Tax=Eumeta variegata TaxID=151549 RepID=A0A4C1TBB1_EUMVA|nr:hypothetical protein EVAR_77849_1 [Eumeta japonica]